MVDSPLRRPAGLRTELNCEGSRLATIEGGFAPVAGGKGWPMTATVLWIIAAILVIAGVVQLLQGQIIFGIVLMVIGALVGPGGYSIFNGRRA